MPDARPSVPADALARFTAAEARLYPLAMVDAAMYERATNLVALTASDLRQTCPDVDAVLARRAGLITGLSEVASVAGLSLVGIPADTVVDAASALRYREVVAEHAAAEGRARLAAAREDGQEWLVDEPDPSEVMAGLFRRVELHVPTGAVLISSVEPDSAGAPAAYTLEVLPAQTVPQPLVAARWETFAERESWVLGAERLRAEISAAS